MEWLIYGGSVALIVIAIIAAVVKGDDDTPRPPSRWD